jgi:hypothetical protein
MSWMDYVDEYLINFEYPGHVKAKNVCEHAAIIGNLDGTIWASSSGFEIKDFDILKKCFYKQDKIDSTFKYQEILIGKEKYYVMKMDYELEIMYLGNYDGGVVIAKSALAFVIGTYNKNMKITISKNEIETQNQGRTFRAVQSLVLFLKENNL